MRRVALVVATAVIGTGCFTYRPVPMTGVTTGTSVKVTLTDAGTKSVEPAVGPYVLSFEGVVRSSDPTQLSVALESVSRRDAGQSRWNGELVNVATGDIRELQEKKLSKVRSWTAGGALIAGGTAVIVAIARALGSSSGSTTRPPLPPP
jgi:hypothetical protein